MNTFREALFAAAMAGSLLCAHGMAAGADSPQPGMSYASLKNLPDFSGGWVPMTALWATGVPENFSIPREVKPEVVAQAAARRNQFISGAEIDRGYCQPPMFGGQMPMRAGGSLEVLFTPGRVTIAAESGLVRRLYIRRTPIPGALEESRTGTSIAHWEGKTLVVETTGMSRNAELMPGIRVGAHARVVERISLEDADTLAIESVVTAPDALTAPLKTVVRYRRARDRVFTEFDTCVAGDRAYDEARKTERFDVSPPPDLPPPPK